MPSVRQRLWKSQIQQQALLEFGLLKQACPESIYLSLTPGNFALWSGVMFVRKGPYAPAILRFQIAFPQRYPDLPPLVLFTSDVFHPLVTPLTTYTYTTGSNAADTVSATDEDRLLPGGFSLRHGFPRWFQKPQRTSSSSPMFQDIPKPALQIEGRIGDSDDRASRPKSPLKGLQSVHMPPPKDEGGSVKDVAPSIFEVLRYLKMSFEDEAILDDLPVEAAGNPGAWNAWRAYRRKAKPLRTISDSASSRQGTPQKGTDTPGRSKPSGEWNWDGVWVDRVRRGVNNSVSEAMLFGGVDGDDLIHFLDLEDEAADALRDRLRGTLDTATVAQSSSQPE